MAKKVAFLFSGQGAQVVGMGKKIYETNPAVRTFYQRAQEILGFDIARICFEGPQERLNETDVCQPALLVTCLAIYEDFKANTDMTCFGICATAGLSLGEYTALVVAEALSFEDAVYLVKKRGEYMHEACQMTRSGMCSIIGLEREKVEEACRQAGGVVCVANINCPGQIVISGEISALEKASEICKDMGAKKIIPLRVEGAYHSPIMKPAQEKFQKEIERVKISKAKIPVVANTTAMPMTQPEEIYQELSNQILRPVLWEDSIRKMAQMGVIAFYEFGPGGVLTGLARKIVPQMEFYSYQGS